ncbi:MAG: putative oxidoreductase [Labilithrix sp.]|nr:putative oxidoreductase [Labilithrix sp.]
MSSLPKRVLLTGATGFVGSHVHPVLEARGFDVVGGTRHPDKARSDAPGKRFCHIDLGDAGAVDRAVADVDAVVYLVHSMAEDRHYDRTERANAELVRDAAARHGIDRIVYLGGMAPRGKVSKHLRSRLEVGKVLRSGSVPVVELQATMIIGGGSESFRIVRDLAARLPWMLLPKWLKSESEPVAIRDVTTAIAHALEMPLPESRVLPIPGPERLSGRDMLVRTARALGQAPRMVDVPLITPALSAQWIRLVTRANPAVSKQLVEGLGSDIVAEGPTLWDELPDHQRTSFDEAVRLALRDEERSLPGATRLLESILHRVAAR